MKALLVSLQVAFDLQIFTKSGLFSEAKQFYFCLVDLHKVKAVLEDPRHTFKLR